MITTGYVMPLWTKKPKIRIIDRTIRILLEYEYKPFYLPTRGRAEYKKLDKSSETPGKTDLATFLSNDSNSSDAIVDLSEQLSKYVPDDGSNPYENSVVIIDEVHNFILRVTNRSKSENSTTYSTTPLTAKWSPSLERPSLTVRTKLPS
jgi:hypothetical protein